jgi:hypothetical protein
MYPKYVPSAKCFGDSHSLEQLGCQSNRHLKQDSSRMKLTSTGCSPLPVMRHIC